MARQQPAVLVVQPSEQKSKRPGQDQGQPKCAKNAPEDGFHQWFATEQNRTTASKWRLFLVGVSAAGGCYAGQGGVCHRASVCRAWSAYGRACPACTLHCA